MPEQADAAPSDEELVGRARAGDEAAFSELMIRHRAAVYRTAWRLTGDHAEADDLSQEAFVKAYRALGSFRGDSKFRTWVVRIVMNLAFTARLTRRPLVSIEEVGALPAGGVPADRQLLGRQVRAAVESLPPRQRQVLLLKVYEGLKFQEIADLAGISVGTAKATFFHAVRSLRGRLGAPAPIGREEVGT
jgi:RNA polymerase sigma-70 factor (ECF subfamily)